MTIKTRRFEVDTYSSNLIEVDVSENDVFDAVDISDFIKHHGTSEILKHIDKEVAADYFDLIEKP